MNSVAIAASPYFLTAAAGLILYSLYHQRKRTANLEATAKSLGFRFSRTARSETWPRHERFELLAKGRKRKIANEMWMPGSGSSISLFEYSYLYSTGDGTRTSIKTVLSISRSRLQAPRLLLHPKVILPRFVPDLRAESNNFELSPSFAENYVLQGDDEAGIHAFFNDRLIAFFEEHGGLHMEADQDTLILYQPAKRFGTNDIESFYAQGRELLSLLK